MNDPSMRAMHINQLKDRVARSDYTVDAAAVAEALLSRPTARRSILPAAAVSRPGARSPRANGSDRRS
jgi:Anti-sigma-28 factor, FlgM